MVNAKKVLKGVVKGNMFQLGDVSLLINDNPSGPIPVELPYIIHSDDSQDISKIMSGINKNKHILLRGPTGCGKTATIRYLATKTNNPYRRMQLNGSTNIDNFVGRYILTSNGTEWRDGVLVEAMKKGQWLVLDELNMALPEIIAVLNAVMDDDGQLLVDDHENETILKHPNFRLFACINPTEEYVGTKELNRALIDRFGMVLEFNYPRAEIEKKIIIQHTKLDPQFGKVDGRKSIVDRMIELSQIIREKYQKQELIFNCSTRQLIQWGDLVYELGVKSAAQVTLLAKAEKEERGKIRVELDKLFRDDEDISYQQLQMRLKAEEDLALEEELKKAKSDLEAATSGGLSTSGTIQSTLPNETLDGGEIAF